MKYSILILLLLPFVGHAQQKIDFNQGRVVQQGYCDTIPFELVRDKIMVNVTLNGKPRRFIFDTGATTIISNELQEEMQNPALGIVGQFDINQTRKEIKVVRLQAIQFGNLTFVDIPATVNDLKNAPFTSCLAADGLIGSNLLRNSIVSINMTHSILILTDNIARVDIQNAYTSDLKLDKQSGPYATIRISDKIKFEGLFDSGSDEFLSMTKEVIKKALKSNEATILNTGFGKTIVGFHGMEDAEKKTRIQFKRLSLEAFQIQDFITVSSEGSENSIGLGLAVYGVITVDYLNKQFYFKGNQAIQVFKDSTTFGFTIQPEPDFFSIGLVWSGTQAEQIGLKSGFRVLKMNGTELPNRTPEVDCRVFLARVFNADIMHLTYADDQNIVKTVVLQKAR